MRVPFSWLKECIPTTRSPAEVAEVLTMGGMEAERVEHLVPPFSGVVVGQVVEVAPHPSADRLQVAKVFDGAEYFQIVCGAPNCRPDIKVAFAKIGAVLEAGEKPLSIKRSKLRGVESHGMLCSAVELGLGPDDDGIIELPDGWVVGRDLTDYYGETVIELALTPNLGHCFGILGIARELSALTQESLAPKVVSLQESTTPLDVQVEVRDPLACPRYAIRVVRNVHVGPSPDWMQRRLAAAGIRPINNVVDVTNYVMLELGQPLHAFDYEQIAGKRLVVRQAEENETFTTLDGTSRALTPDVLLICDGKRPIALAGIMGGQNSAVNEEATTIVLEAAYFDPKVIRRAAKGLQMHTESSKRFERGTDPLGVVAALERAASLLTGEVDAGVVDIVQSHFPRREITLRADWLNQVLGTQLSATEVSDLLKRLGCDVTLVHESLTVAVPSYRSDLTLAIDLIEEVARLYGYHNIASSARRQTMSPMPHTPLFLFERKVRKHLVGMGLQELMTSNLISPTLAKETLGNEEWISVLNPASAEQSVLRPSLFPGLLQVVVHNADHQVRDVYGFEIGRVHFHADDELKEKTQLGIVLTGRAHPPAWDTQEREFDFFDLKGVVEMLCEQVGLQAISFRPSQLNHFHPGRQATLTRDTHDIGFLGEVHPGLLRILHIRNPVLYAELTLPALLCHQATPPLFSPLPQFPGSFRDWTATLSEETPFDSVLQLAHAISSRLLKKVRLIAIYRGDSVDAGWKNMTFRFAYRDDRKTVSDEGVQAEHDRIIKQIQLQLGERIKAV